MYTHGRWLKDETGRIYIARGVNLSGSTKVPAFPDGASHKRDSLINDTDVSFVGKPFPLEEADEHFGRLKSWGFTFLRFLVTWEAVEHKGPGQYDEEYLDYLEAVIEKAAQYGIDLFIDPHNDMWSRWTGGDGAPGWTLDLCGMKLSAFHPTGASVLHAYYEGELPRMIWTTNQFKLGTATMFTLFFAGDDFAPRTTIDGEPAREFLQGHYMNAMKQIARRLRNNTNVVGFETMNEPFEGFVGHKHCRRLKPSFLRIGPCPTPYQSMIAASGYPVKVPFYEMTGYIPRKKRNVLLNPGKLRLWKEGYECVWKQHGVWSDESGKPVLLQPDYFTRVKGKAVYFERDYLKPFMKRFVTEIRSVKQDFIIFLGSVPGSDRVQWTEEDGANVVNADHWYDGRTLFYKTFYPGFALSPGKYFPILGKKRVQKLFINELASIKKVSAEKMGDIPTHIGEFGLPFDMFHKKAYTTGDFSLHVQAMNMYMNAMDAHLFNFTLWNYTPDNTNEHGDLWNEEDLSIFSRSQQDDPGDINSGGRAVPGFCRPYPRKVAGTPLSISFDLASRVFTFRFLPDPRISGPTEIFVPPFHYPRGFEVELSSGSWEEVPENYCIHIYPSEPEMIDNVSLPDKDDPFYKEIRREAAEKEGVPCEVIIKPVVLMCYQL